ncbi:glycoside hydrolase family 2 protein [Pseudactinotalea sp. Z1748]|uniref:glycoside hydrolase family 2 protein n=1 Tax=Pseudactinotalea sp. Z1748 TaxID=3413027 RepID=UPI003C7EAEEC
MTYPDPARRRAPLHCGWQLHLRHGAPGAPADLQNQAIDAVVPGTVHTDLIATGHLADPNVGTREDEQHWIGASTWSYATTIAAPAEQGERTELLFEGLDTHAEVFLDGARLGETKNMHRRFRFDVTGLLSHAEHRLEVVFHPIMAEVDRVREDVGVMPAVEATHYPYVRKMACNFGWDWGPVFITAGIWRPVLLDTWSVAALDDPVLLATLDGDDGVLRLAATVRSTGAEADLLVRVRVEDHPHSGGGDFPGDGAGGHDDGAHPGAYRTTAQVRGGRVEAEVRIPQVRPWWPVGMGEATRYPVTLELCTADGQVLDRVERRVGFRTVELVQEPDAHGVGFQTVINGRAVNARGFNWIPDLPFASAIGAERYRRRLDQARAANANTLRVWGGGIFEPAEFYDACDERGLMVWQDFLFSCAAYPETPWFREEIEAEARQAITDLSHHPSLILWNANNECLMGYDEWGWKEILDGRPWGAHYYGELLPSLVAELDPSRPYIPGSPNSGDLTTSPNADERGPSHLWDVWNELDMVAYRDRTPPFAAEFGFCGPPTHATLRAAVPEGELTLDNPVVRHHLRAENGVHKLNSRIGAHFPAVATDDDWLWIAQLHQARALILGVDHLRSLPRCTGALVWQLNDCWPVISWAAVDSQERLKPLWYALRSAFAPQRLSVQPRVGALVLAAVNDSGQPWSVTATVRRVAFDGTEHASTEVALEVPVAGTAQVALPARVATPGDERAELLVIEAPGAERTTWFWARDTELAYPRAGWDTQVHQAQDGVDLVVTAETLVRDLTVFPDRLLNADGDPLPASAVASRALITLLPGESTRIRIPGAGPEHAEALMTRPVLRAANDIEELAPAR